MQPWKSRRVPKADDRDSHSQRMNLKPLPRAGPASWLCRQVTQEAQGGSVTFLNFLRSAVTPAGSGQNQPSHQDLPFQHVPPVSS